MMSASEPLPTYPSFERDLQYRLQKQNEVIVSLIQRKISCSDDLLAALQEITEAAARTLNVERSSIWLFDENRTAIRCIDLFSYSENRHYAGHLLKTDTAPEYFRALEETRAVVAHNCLSDIRTKSFAEQYLKPIGISSMLDTALWVDGVMIGVLCNEHIGPVRTWHFDEENFAGSLADIVALTFEVCELRLTEEKLAERLDFKELIVKLSSQFINLSADAIDNGVRDALRMISEFALVDRSFVYLLAEDNQTFEKAYEWCRAGIAPRPTLPVNTSEHPDWFQQRILSGKIVKFTNFDSFPNAAQENIERWQSLQIQSIIGVPILDSGDVVGFVGFDMLTNAVEWNEDKISLLQIAGDIFMNVLKRKSTEEVLRAMQFSIDRAADSVFWVGPDARIRYANEAACLSLGYTRKELLEKTVYDVSGNVTPDNWPMHWQKVKAGGAVTFESLQRTKDGHEVPVEITINHLRFQGKEYHCAFARNITERKRSQEILEKQRAFFRKVIDMNPNFIFAKDRKGRFVLVNQAVADAYGVTVETLIGKTDRDFNTNAVEVEKFLADDLEVMDTKIEKLIPEEQITDAAGSVRYLQTAKLPIIGKDGKANLVLGVATDITERKEAEAEQHRLVLQMQHAQKLESLGVLAGGIAHDFNNLLMAILGNAGLAATEVSSDSVLFSRIDNITIAAKRAAELTNQLLAYSGRGQFVVQSTDLSKLVVEMSALLETIISKKAVLEYDFSNDIPSIRADASQIRQIVMNLITNASDALGEQTGVIRIKTGTIRATRDFLSKMYLDDQLPEGNYVSLEVEDNGSGMTQETLQRIFDPFFSTKFTGRGLGLAAVLGIVRSHKGALSVQSEIGQGTRFLVLFPSISSEKPLLNEKRIVQKFKGEGKGLILLVDDEESTRAVSRAMLEHLGYSVIEAPDGEKAVAIFKSRAEELTSVLLDMTMPKMDGVETWREIAKIRPDVPVILTSGYSEQEASLRFHGKKLAGFLQKPYGADLLGEKLLEVLSQTRGELKA